MSIKLSILIFSLIFVYNKSKYGKNQLYRNSAERLLEVAVLSFLLTIQYRYVKIIFSINGVVMKIVEIKWY